MPLRREPATLYSSAKAVLTKHIAFRVRLVLHCRPYVACTLNYLDTVISSLPAAVATQLAQKALRCADLLCERSPLTPSLLHLLVRVLIHDSTTAFPITTLDSYQVRQAVLNRLCDLRHLQIYYNLQHFHENFNILLTLQRLQSLSNLRKVYLSQWCTDEIAHLLGKSCLNLHILDAQGSLSLTDSSVPSLSRCQRLKVLLICSTSISDTGYQKILENLPLLQKIGPCKSLNFIITKMKKNNGRCLSLREYESNTMPDENVFSMCPHLTTIHLFGANLWKEPKISHQATHLKLQVNVGNYLNQLLTSNIVQLDLLDYPITEEDITAMANVCDKLRILRLNRLGNLCRLVTRKKEAFFHLEELEIPDSALALDILMASPRIYKLLIQPQNSPHSPGVFSTHIVLHKILAKNPLLCLQSFYLSTKCNFSVKTLLNFVQACPQLRFMGNFQTWGRTWETKIHQIYTFLQEQNLAVELIL